MNEISPTRPININIINTALVMSLTSLVTPKLKPHVPNADITSKKICKKDNLPCSVADIIIMLINLINDAIVNTANDLCTSIICTSLLKILIPVLSPVLLKLITNKIKIANVVVLIPPPTELGDDPININNPITIFVASLKCDTSIVCKPALLVVDDWNNA